MDQAPLQDATGTMALMQFEELGVPRAKVQRAVQYVDHNVVQLDYKNPDDHRMLQALARKYGLHFSRPGNGISHYIHMERFGKPGQTMLRADSHHTTAGSTSPSCSAATRTRSPARRSSKYGSRARSIAPGSRPRTSSSNSSGG